jgi:hypothetical protein
MKALVVGGDSQVGKKLAAYLGCPATSRRVGASLSYDLAFSRPQSLPKADVIYLVASMTKFRDCEMNPDAYIINVDAQVRIASHFRQAHIVYISSEAAEWPNQTAYGSQKRMAEVSLLAACGYDRLCVVRPTKIDPSNIGSLCTYLGHLGDNRSCGAYRWSKAKEVEIHDLPSIVPSFQKHSDCNDNLHGCRLVSDGLVCQGKCEWQALAA